MRLYFCLSVSSFDIIILTTPPSISLFFSSLHWRKITKHTHLCDIFIQILVDIEVNFSIIEVCKTSLTLRITPYTCESSRQFVKEIQFTVWESVGGKRNQEPLMNKWNICDFSTWLQCRDCSMRLRMKILAWMGWFECGPNEAVLNKLLYLAYGQSHRNSSRYNAFNFNF